MNAPVAGGCGDPSEHPRTSARITELVEAHVSIDAFATALGHHAFQLERELIEAGKRLSDSAPLLDQAQKAAIHAQERCLEAQDMAFKAVADAAAVRELMNVYNLGGWTDAVAPMKRALAAEAEVEAMQKALDANWVQHQAVIKARKDAEYAEEMRAALEVAVSLVHIPDHAWDTDDDARLAKCVAALANHQPKEK